MARVIAIANQKGGVGKTTTAVNLGASLAVAEQRTLIIDTDPQGNTTSALGFPKDPVRQTLYQTLILGEPIEKVTIDAQIEGLDLVPSDRNLVGAAVELVNMDDREYRLREALRKSRDNYAFILIDCPPSLDLLTLNALAASDSVLVPIQCEYLALEGVSELLDTLSRLQKSINPSLAIEGILLTMYDDRTTLSKQVAADLRSFFGDKVFESVIPRNVRLAEAPSHGMPVIFYDIQLGRGLSALIREPEPQPQVPPQAVGAAGSQATTGAAAAVVPAWARNEGLIEADIDLIDPSPYQPRTRFREQTLDELARSIVASGIVQPLVVRRIGNRYQLIAGERRWRAAQRASLRRVPVVIHDVPEQSAMEMTVVENLQREDLNPIEQARAFQRLTDDFTMTQEQVAERTGKDRTTIANALRLLKLDDTIQDLIEDGLVSAGHGRALLAIESLEDRLEIARRVSRGGLTVRQVERLSTRSSKPKAIATEVVADPNVKAALDELQKKYGTRVQMRAIAPGKAGQLVFEYYDASDLTRLYDQLMRE
jgi:chromosome partitioning protein